MYDFFIHPPGPVAAPFLVLIGVAMVVVGVRRIRRGRAMRRWASTSARIIKSQPVSTSEGGYDAHVEYEYEVRGQQHHGQVIFAGSSTNMDVVNGERRLTKYAPGDDLLVYYDPANPADSVVQRYTWSSQTTLMYVGSLMVVFGVLLLMAVWI
jgi:hypothetical protein